jgi:hypothetical protein
MFAFAKCFDFGVLLYSRPEATKGVNPEWGRTCLCSSLRHVDDVGGAVLSNDSKQKGTTAMNLLVSRKRREELRSCAPRVRNCTHAHSSLERNCDVAPHFHLNFNAASSCHCGTHATDGVALVLCYEVFKPGTVARFRLRRLWIQVLGVCMIVGC